MLSALGLVIATLMNGNKRKGDGPGGNEDKMIKNNVSFKDSIQQFKHFMWIKQIDRKRKKCELVRHDKLGRMEEKKEKKTESHQDLQGTCD